MPVPAGSSGSDRADVKKWIEDTFGTETWQQLGWAQCSALCAAKRRREAAQPRCAKRPPASPNGGGDQQAQQRQPPRHAHTKTAPPPAQPGPSSGQVLHQGQQETGDVALGGWQTVQRGRKPKQPRPTTAPAPAVPGALIAPQRPADRPAGRPAARPAARPAVDPAAHPAGPFPAPASSCRDWPADWRLRAEDWGGPLLTAEQAQAGCAGLRLCSVQEAKALHRALAAQPQAAAAVLVRSPCGDLGTPLAVTAVLSTPQGLERAPAWQYLAGPPAAVVAPVPRAAPACAGSAAPVPRIAVEAILERSGADPAAWRTAENATAGRQMLPALQKAGLPACDAGAARCVA